MKGPLAIIGVGLAAVVCCIAGPAVIIAAIASVGISGAVGGLTAALLVAAVVFALVAVRAGRRRRRCTPDEAGPEQRPRSSTRTEAS